MKPWIKDVLELQVADMKTKRMNRRLKESPNEKKEIIAGIEVEKEKVAKAKGKLLETEKEIKSLEIKLDSIKAKINELQQKSAMIKKNEEYKAFLNEIASQKSFISSLETKQLGYFEQLDADKKVLATAEKSLKNMEKESDESIKDIDEMEKVLQSEIEKALEARKPLLEKLDPYVLPIYNRLIKKDGEPLVRVHNNTCGFCHLKLIPQTVNDAKKGLITCCDSCGHLIYFPDEE